MRRGFIALLLGTPLALNTGNVALKYRRALQKIQRLAEQEAGIMARQDGLPILPPPQTIWREFWDLAAEGLASGKVTP